MFGFKKRDPVCKMTEEKGKGASKHGEWFCSEHCVALYEKKMERNKAPGCCHQ